MHPLPHLSLSLPNLGGQSDTCVSLPDRSPQLWTRPFNKRLGLCALCSCASTLGFPNTRWSTEIPTLNALYIVHVCPLLRVTPTPAYHILFALNAWVHFHQKQQCALFFFAKSPFFRVGNGEPAIDICCSNVLHSTFIPNKVMGLLKSGWGRVPQYRTLASKVGNLPKQLTSKTSLPFFTCVLDIFTLIQKTLHGREIISLSLSSSGSLHV